MNPQKLKDLAFNVMCLSNRNLGDPEGLPVAIMKIYGHTGVVDVMVYESGWDFGCMVTRIYTCPMYAEDFDAWADEVNAELNRLIRKRLKMEKEMVKQK